MTLLDPLSFLSACIHSHTKLDSVVVLQVVLLLPCYQNRFVFSLSHSEKKGVLCLSVFGNKNHSQSFSYKKKRTCVSVSKVTYESYSSSSKENKIYCKVHSCSICTIKLHHTIHTSFNFFYEEFYKSEYRSVSIWQKSI